MKCEKDRDSVLFSTPGPGGDYKSAGSLITSRNVAQLLRFQFLLTPICPGRLLQKLVLNLSAKKEYREVLLDGVVMLMDSDFEGARRVLREREGGKKEKEGNGAGGDFDLDLDLDFPPRKLLGVQVDSSCSYSRRQTRQVVVKAAIAHNSASGNLPMDLLRERGSGEVPVVVCGRLVELLFFLCNNSKSCCRKMLGSEECLAVLMGMLEKKHVCGSLKLLDQMLQLIEVIVSPLANLPIE